MTGGSLDGTVRALAAPDLTELLEAAEAALSVKDLDGRYVHVNARAAALLGRPADEIVGRTDAELLPAGRAAEVRTRDLEAIAGRAPRRDAIDLPGPDGRRRTLLDVRVPARDEDDRVTQLTTISLDLSDVRETGADFPRALEARLDQARRLEVVGQLAGGLAHDFGNLVATIRSAAEELLARRAGARDEELVAIYEASDRAAELCRQLLIFARQERTSAEPLDVGLVVRELRPLLRAALTRAIELEIPLTVGIPPVRIDRRRLEQALLNLAVNARDAMPDGGTIAITTEVVELDEGYAEMNPGVVPGRYAHVAVADTGPGMRPETRAHAFEPFFTTKPRGEGTGLGLSTVYGVVTQAGGVVRLESEPGEGTTVRLYLPLAGSSGDQPERAPRSWAPAPAPPPRGRGERLLVVDDAAPLRRHADRILGRRGYDVAVAQSAEEAASLLDEGMEVDLLICDVRLPGADGITFAGRLRERVPGVPILVTSGDPSDAELVAQLAQPASFILKPFRAEQMLVEVRALLDQRTA